MGSTSSKEHDPNPTELGTYASAGGGGQYPLRHHPQYGSSGSNAHGHTSASSHQNHPSYHDGSTTSAGGGRSSSTGDAAMYNAAGHDPYYTKSAYPPSQHPQQSQGRMYHDADPKHSSGHAPNDAMDIDPPAAPSDLAFLPSNLPPSQLDSTSAGGSLESDSGSTSGALNSAPSAADVVPMVFRWEHGGRNVYITGTFNGWSKQCPMHRSGNDFTYIANLTRGKHAYKFVVDDEWRFAPDQLTVADVEGNVNNFVDVSEFTPLSDFETSTKHSDEKNERGESAYGRFIPDIDEYTKEPPPLPPHLRHIILNKTPPTVDSRLLPVPQHVALNHLYCTAIKDGMMVLGITNRYKQKFVTTVYYSLMPGAN